jgi:hypothetical protein
LVLQTPEQKGSHIVVDFQPGADRLVIADLVERLGKRDATQRGHDTAVITYVRLVQRLNEQEHPVTTADEETRVWHKRRDGWRHVHFHRSQNARP